MTWSKQCYLGFHPKFIRDSILRNEIGLYPNYKMSQLKTTIRRSVLACLQYNHLSWYCAWLTSYLSNHVKTGGKFNQLHSTCGMTNLLSSSQHVQLTKSESIFTIRRRLSMRSLFSSSFTRVKLAKASSRWKKEKQMYYWTFCWIMGAFDTFF